MTQSYYCLSCTQAGKVRFKKNAGVYEVWNLIERDHQSKSPDCTERTGNIVLEKYEKKK